MPQKKKTTYKKTSTKKSASKKQTQKKPEFSSVHYIMPWIMGVAAVFCAICLFFTDYSGFVGKWLHDLFLGLFSGAGYAAPFVLLVIAFFWKTDAKNFYIKYRITFAVIITISLAAFIHATGDLTKTFAMTALWKEGLNLHGGGAIGGFVGSCLYVAIGKPGLIIVTVLLFVIFTIFFVGFTPASLAKYISHYIKEKKVEHEEHKKERALHTDKPEAYLPEEDDYYTEPEKIINTDEPADNTPKVDPEIFERIKSEINATVEEKAETPALKNPTPDLEAVFLDEQAQQLIEKAAKETELEVERKPVEEE